MNRHEAMNHCEKLRELMGEHPGANDRAIDAAKKIQHAFAHNGPNNSYLHEKVSNFIIALESWCSVRKWQKWGADPARLKGILLNDLAKLEGAIETCFPPESEK